jgi:hypothetical protein
MPGEFTVTRSRICVQDHDTVGSGKCGDRPSKEDVKELGEVMMCGTGGIEV